MQHRLILMVLLILILGLRSKATMKNINIWMLLFSNQSDFQLFCGYNFLFILILQGKEILQYVQFAKIYLLLFPRKREPLDLRSTSTNPISILANVEFRNFNTLGCSIRNTCITHLWGWAVHRFARNFKDHFVLSMIRITMTLLLFNCCCLAQKNSEMSLRNANIYSYQYMDKSLIFSKYIYINESYKILINYDCIVVFHNKASDTINNINILYSRKISIIGNWIIGSLDDDTVIAMNFINKSIAKFYSFNHSLEGANDSVCFIVGYSIYKNKFSYQTLSLMSDTLALSNKMYVYPRKIGGDTILVLDYFSDEFKFFNFARIVDEKNKYYYHEIWKCDSLILRCDNGDDDIFSNYTSIYYHPDEYFIYIQKHGQCLSGVVSGFYTMFFSIRDTVLFPIEDSGFLKTRDSIVDAVKDSLNKIEIKKILYRYKKKYDRIVSYRKYNRFIFFEVIVKYPWSNEESEYYVYDLNQKKILTKLQPVLVDD